MISELVDYLRAEILATGVDVVYDDYIPQVNNKENIAVLIFETSENTNTHTGTVFSSQQIKVLYRGFSNTSTSRKDNKNKMYDIVNTLNDSYSVDLPNIWVTSIMTDVVNLDFTDDRGVQHFSVTATILFNNK